MRVNSVDKQTIENHFRSNYQLFYARYLPKLQKARGDEMKAICPFHEDRNPSLSVNNQTGLFKCFGCDAAGSILDFYAMKHGLDTRQDINRIINEIAQQFGITNGNHKKTNPAIVARYDYLSESGELLYQVARDENKGFPSRQPDGNGGWKNNLAGVCRVPYCLPKVLKAEEILIGEGEKDVDNLFALGFTATTNSGGSGNWPDHFASYFTGKDIVLIPDNDERGRIHMSKVAANLKGHVASIRWLELPNLPEKGDVSDFIATFSSRDEAAERLAILIESSPIYKQPDTTTSELKMINAATLIESEPPPPDQIMEDTFDTGDKVAIIGSSKLRKSFFLLQMVLSLAAGRNFLSWQITRPRRVLHCQFEIKDHHFHRRLKRMARAMGIASNDLGDRLRIINARGLGISGPEGIERIQKVAIDFSPDVICFDPLYKLTTGVENDAQDSKIILNAFDKLAEQTGAAPIYVHHDAKGSPGDRDIRDRGAGSNVLGRDYDCCITLTAHSQDTDAAVVEILLRNYRPQEPFTITWTEDKNGDYRFSERPDIFPEKKTSKTKSQPVSLATYLTSAASILGDDEMEIAPFKAIFKTQTGLSDHRIRDFLMWATCGGNPYLMTREERGYRTNKKWLKVVRRPDDKK